MPHVPDGAVFDADPGRAGTFDETAGVGRENLLPADAIRARSRRWRRSPRAALLLDSAALGDPVVRTPQEVEVFVARAPEDILRADPYAASLAERVRRIYESALRTPAPWPSAEQVTARLAMSPTTLRRHLAAEGTTLRDIASDVRRDSAIASLVEGRESVAEIADRLGYGDPTAFTRAFRRWTGGTPGAYRNEGTAP